MDAPFFDFCVELRRRGLQVSVREQRALYQLLQCWDLTDRDRFRAAVSCLLGRGQQEVELVSDLFDAFFPRVDASQTAEYPALAALPGSLQWWRRCLPLAVLCLLLGLLIAMGGIRRDSAKAGLVPQAVSAAMDLAPPDDAGIPPQQASPPSEFVVPPLPILSWHFRFALANSCSAGVFLAACLALFLIRRRYEIISQLRTHLLERQSSIRGPSEFHMQSVSVEPRLPRDDLEEVSALLLRLCSWRSGGRELDLSATVRAAGMRGAVTEVKYRARRQREQILVILDCSGEMRPFLPRVRAWLNGLAQRGVELQVRYFNEAWDLVDEAARSINLASASLPPQPTLLITTGLVLVSEEGQRQPWVQAISCQPRCAIINPIREKAFWRTRLRERLATFPLSLPGLICAAYQLAHDRSVVPRRLENCGGDADAFHMAWPEIHRILQLAALLPQNTIELVEWLRQRFAPECPDEAVWLATDYSTDPSGAMFVFPKHLQQALNRELVQSDPRLADLARCGLLEKLIASEPPAHTEAHLRWRLACALLRVCLRDPDLRQAAGATGAVRELQQLQQSPIRDEVLYQIDACELETLGVHAVADLALASVEALTPASLDAAAPAFSSAGAAPRSIYPELGDILAPFLLALLIWSSIVFIQLFPRPQHEPLYYATFRADGEDKGVLDVIPMRDGSPLIVRLYEDEQATAQSIRVPGNFQVNRSTFARHVHVRAELEDGRLGYSNDVVIPALSRTSGPVDLGETADLRDAPDLARPKRVNLPIRGPQVRDNPPDIKEPEISADLRASADQTLSNAQTDYVNGNFSQAISVAKSVQRINPTRAWRIIGASACNMKDVKLASEAFKHLDSASRQYLVYTCQRQGITNTNGSAFRLNEQ